MAEKPRVELGFEGIASIVDWLNHYLLPLMFTPLLSSSHNKGLKRLEAPFAYS